MSRTGRLIVISGPSGVGKGTVGKRLAERIDAEVSTSATTRPPGPQEKDGREYYFKSKNEFERMIGDGELLEHAEYLGNYYGTPVKPVLEALDAGRDVILEIEVEGGKQVANRLSGAIMIFLLPPSDAELRSRLEGRSRDAPAEIDRRLANARREIELGKRAGVYDHWVVNDNVDRAVDEIKRILDARRKDT